MQSAELTGISDYKHTHLQFRKQGVVLFKAVRYSLEFLKFQIRGLQTERRLLKLSIGVNKTLVSYGTF